jgi:hypothetical protein
MKLTHDADLTHEDARGWYNSYGWHITTANEGDVTIDAVEYDWLDGTDAEAIAKLRETYDALTDDEAESIVAKAREVRDLCVLLAKGEQPCTVIETMRVRRRAA